MGTSLVASIWATQADFSCPLKKISFLCLVLF